MILGQRMDRIARARLKDWLRSEGITNTGPGGTGKSVRIHGYEEWTFGADGLIAESKGHYDEAEYQRQLK